LPGGGSIERITPVMGQYPDRFVRFANAEGGAIGAGELKHPVQVEGPEMSRV
jgi:hypothetical protein